MLFKKVYPRNFFVKLTALHLAIVHFTVEVTFLKAAKYLKIIMI